jgi:hypothetical protein
MEVSCHKCEHVWEYQGRSAFLVTCPKCHIKSNVFIEENLKYAEKAICPECGKEFLKREKRSRCCSTQCFQRSSAKRGAKAFHEKHSQSGSNNNNWKGGITKDNVRYLNIQRERYPERVGCREITMQAVRSGKLIRPSNCQSCGASVRVFAHHNDYSKPFDVLWLCRPCHRKLHGGRY